MSTLSLRLPDSLHRRARDLAKRDHVSVNQLVTSALAEKIAALDTEEYLEARAAKGDPSAFHRVLSRVPDLEPEPGDQL